MLYEQMYIKNQHIVIHCKYDDKNNIINFIRTNQALDKSAWLWMDIKPTSVGVVHFPDGLIQLALPNHDEYFCFDQICEYLRTIGNYRFLNEDLDCDCDPDDEAYVKLRSNIGGWKK